MSLKTVAKEISASTGTKGFFVGWGIRFFQLAISIGLSLPVIDSYEKTMIELIFSLNGKLGFEIFGSMVQFFQQFISYSQIDLFIAP